MECFYRSFKQESISCLSILVSLSCYKEITFLWKSYSTFFIFLVKTTLETRCIFRKPHLIAAVQQDTPGFDSIWTYGMRGRRPGSPRSLPYLPDKLKRSSVDLAGHPDPWLRRSSRFCSQWLEGPGLCWNLLVARFSLFFLLLDLGYTSVHPTGIFRSQDLSKATFAVGLLEKVRPGQREEKRN